FYGVLLENHPPDSPTPWFHGQVIDMLFFPLFDFTWPDWVPFVGGEYFLFFSPVFNIADSSIFIGVVIILIFQRRFFHHETEEVATVPDADLSPEQPVTQDREPLS
ncbi:MAG TPA: signal peptidase II, partial [Ohtaekwangia sp.]|nr:signal peptidase II [Ohtaekwangia sp.]